MTSKKIPLFRLLALTKPYLGSLFLGLLALFGGSAVSLLFPAIVRELLKPDRFSWLHTHPYHVAAVLICLLAIQGVCFYIRGLQFGSVGQKVVAGIRTELFDKLIKRNISFFDKSSTGDLLSRLHSDTLILQDALSIKLAVVTRYSLQVVVGILCMAYLSPLLTIVLLLIIPVLGILTFFLFRKLRALSRRQQKSLGIATQIADETIGGIKIVKAFAEESSSSNRYKSAIKQVLDDGLERISLSAYFSSFINFLLHGSIVAVLLVGIQLVIGNKLPLEDLAAFLLYGVIVAVSFTFLLGGYSDLAQALGVGDRILDLLEEESQTSRVPDSTINTKTSPSIKLNRVSFAYPSRPEKLSLDDLTLSIPAGKTCALVGPTGAGKSTILNLLLCFYKPETGEIYIDDTNILEIGAQLIRDSIGYVPQEPILFNISLRENILFGNSDISKHQLKSVLDSIGLSKLIEDLPDGIDTVVGENGKLLSGGQRQLVSIARALLRDPAIVLLDEPTSALDSESEAVILDAAKVLLKDRTALIVAHRLSTVQGADIIAVIENGSVIQTGNHQELSTAPGLYRSFLEHQNLDISKRSLG